MQSLSKADRADDPDPLYRRLREKGPVARIGRGADADFVVTGHAEVRALLRDARLSADRTHAPRLRAFLESAPESLRSDSARKSMLVRDEPAHGRLRRLVNQAFSRRSIAELEPRIHAIAEACLDEACRLGPRFDAVAGFAEPVATLVIAELMGIDSADHARFRSWARAQVEGMLGAPVAKERIADALRHLDGYWLELIRLRREAPRDDLVSHLIEAHDAQARLTDLELLAMLNLILVAGHETSANLIGSTLWALLREPERQRQARALDEAGWQNLVEEILRWQSPIQSVARASIEALAIAGVELPAGSAVTLALGAANRDPCVFEDPDRFEPARENAHAHLAFGFGEHVCLGAALARMEVRIAVQAALERFPRLRLEEPRPAWRRTPLLRGLERLPLRV